MRPVVTIVDSAVDLLLMLVKLYRITVLTVNLKQAGNQADL
jgi:hypothetical protein